MTESEIKQFNDLCWGSTQQNQLVAKKGCVEEFLKEFRPGQTDSQRLHDVLEEAIQSHDHQVASVAVSIIPGLSVCVEHVPLLKKFFYQDWHGQHENMIGLFEGVAANVNDNSSEDAVEALGWAAQVRLQYLEFNDSWALASKAIWALGRVPGEKARQMLEFIASTSDEPRRDLAFEKLRERNDSS